MYTNIYTLGRLVTIRSINIVSTSSSGHLSGPGDFPRFRQHATHLAISELCNCTLQCRYFQAAISWLVNSQQSSCEQVFGRVCRNLAVDHGTCDAIWKICTKMFWGPSHSLFDDSGSFLAEKCPEPKPGTEWVTGTKTTTSLFRHNTSHSRFDLTLPGFWRKSFFGYLQKSDVFPGTCFKYDDSVTLSHQFLGVRLGTNLGLKTWPGPGFQVLGSSIWARNNPQWELPRLGRVRFRGPFCAKSSFFLASEGGIWLDRLPCWLCDAQLVSWHSDSYYHSCFASDCWCRKLFFILRSDLGILQVALCFRSMLNMRKNILWRRG